MSEAISFPSDMWSNSASRLWCKMDECAMKLHPTTYCEDPSGTRCIIVTVLPELDRKFCIIDSLLRLRGLASSPVLYCQKVSVDSCLGTGSGLPLQADTSLVESGFSSGEPICEYEIRHPIEARWELNMFEYYWLPHLEKIGHVEMDSFRRWRVFVRFSWLMSRRGIIWWCDSIQGTVWAMIGRPITKFLKLATFAS